MMKRIIVQFPEIRHDTSIAKGKKSIGIKVKVKERTINKHNLTLYNDHSVASLLLKHFSFNNFEMSRQKSRIIPRNFII